MSPRPYRLDQRQAAVDETRLRVLESARVLLASASGYTAFTVEAVARAADVARATVYYQFGTKTGLLEALCDTLAARGQMAGLAHAFTDPDPVAGLDRFVASFGRFWAADRLATRRLRALAALDPEVAAVIAGRDERRRQGLRVLIGRLVGAGRITGDQSATAVRLLQTLTSFETFDSLVGPDRDLIEAIPLVTRLVHAVLSDDTVSDL